VTGLIKNEAFQNYQENSQNRGRGTEVGLRIDVEIERESLSSWSTPLSVLL
jgi:hypothetical protein